MIRLFTVIISLLYFFCNLVISTNITATLVFDNEKKITNISLDKNQSELLLRNWRDQAISGLMAAVASAKIRSVGADVAMMHENCAKRAQDIIKHAQCVSKLLKTPVVKPSTFEFDSKDLGKKLKAVKIGANFVTTKKEPPVLNRIFLKRQQHRLNIKKLRPSHFNFISDNVKQNGSQVSMKSRKKRFAHHSANSYSLQQSRSGMTVLGIVAKHIMTKVLDIKNKTTFVPWQHSLEKAKLTAIAQKRLRQKTKHDDKPYLESDDTKFHEINQKKLMHDISDLLEDGTVTDKRQMIEKLKQIQKSPTGKMMELLRQGIKLVAVLGGKNASEYDDKTLKVMSPRFLSVTEQNTNDEPENAIDVLSPSLFSLHDRGQNFEKAFSLPNLVKGFTSADQQAWLDLIFEASSIDETINAAQTALTKEEFQLKRKKRYQQEMVDGNGIPLYFTKESMTEKFGSSYVKKYEVFEELSKTYSLQQQRDLNETGYTIMTDAQLQLVYGTASPHNNSVIITQYSNRSKEDIESQMFSEIHALAEDKAFQRRLKADAIILMPSSGGVVINDPAAVSVPSILSPTIFTVIVGSPITLGPTILSPWFFLPLITSPRTLSPAILTPFAFVPVILSPLVLHPLILCPGFFNPFVLSPLVLAPLILTPQVFTPLILNPLVMSPSILSPTVGSPLVLSPFVLNPVILSPLTLFALVLSPNVLSPVIMSKLFFSELILSPSFLS